MGLSTPLGYAYGDRNFSVCRVLEKYAYRFFAIAPIILYGCTYLLTPIGVRFFASPGSTVFNMADSGKSLFPSFLCTAASFPDSSSKVLGIKWNLAGSTGS